MTAPHVRVVAWLLVRANAGARTSGNAQAFYELKDRLLKRYGERDVDRPTDVQRIVDVCYGCDGTGFYLYPDEDCYRCGGTGVYQTRWVLLERWLIAGHVFHRPIGPTKPQAVDFIDGKIRHTSIDPRTAAEAVLWVWFLFAPAEWWHAMTTGRQYRQKGERILPMLTLQVLTFVLARWFRRLRPRDCVSCHRSFIRPWRVEGKLFSCTRCVRAQRRLQLAGIEGGDDDDDLPF